MCLVAGTLGLGPGAAHGSEYWRASVIEARGGLVGGAELWVSSHLLSMLGADILAAFLFIAGPLPGASASRRGSARALRPRA